MVSGSSSWVTGIPPDYPPRSARNVLCQLDRLLEGGAVLEGEVGHAHRAGDDEAVLVEAARLGVLGAVAVAVELLARVARRIEQRAAQRPSARPARAAAAVAARQAPGGLAAVEHVAQVLVDVAPPAVGEAGV